MSDPIPLLNEATLDEIAAEIKRRHRAYVLLCDTDHESVTNYSGGVAACFGLVSTAAERMRALIQLDVLAQARSDAGDE